MQRETRVTTGVPGLDEVLYGGFVPRNAYVLRGGPGSGKSTMGYHFLTEGARSGDSAVLICFGENEKSVRENASLLGIDLDDVRIIDLTPSGELAPQYNLLSMPEVEHANYLEPIQATLKELKPKRVVLDSLSMLQYLAPEPFQYRKMMLAFIRTLRDSGSTVLLLSEAGSLIEDREAAFAADGVIELDVSKRWRELRVMKFRGSASISGAHTYRITDTGIEVFPRMAPGNYSQVVSEEQVHSGNSTLDTILHGGLESGTTTMVTGPSGVGKTSITVQYAIEAVRSGRRATIYTFEESTNLIIRRARGMGGEIDSMVERGSLRIVSVEPFSYSPDQFAAVVRNDVVANNTSFVAIDSIAGYRLAVDVDDALERLHSLVVYLRNMGVTSILVNENVELGGLQRVASMPVSYLADNVLYLGYYESNGALYRAIGVLKKRLSDFENSVRDFKLTSRGLEVGEPLLGLRGLLSGLPSLSPNE